MNTTSNSSHFYSAKKDFRRDLHSRSTNTSSPQFSDVDHLSPQVGTVDSSQLGFKSTGSCNGGLPKIREAKVVSKRDFSGAQAHLRVSASTSNRLIRLFLLGGSMAAAAHAPPSNPELVVDISHFLLPNSVVMSQTDFETILDQVYGAAYQDFNYTGGLLDCPGKLEGLSQSMQAWHNNGTDAVKLQDNHELGIPELLLHSNFGIDNIFCWPTDTSHAAQSVKSSGQWTSVFHRVGFNKHIFSVKDYTHVDYLRNIVRHEIMHRYHVNHPDHPASDSVLNKKYYDSNRLPEDMTPSDQTIIKQVKEAGLIIPEPGPLAVKVYLDLDSQAHLKLAVSFREAMERVRLLLFKGGFKDGIDIVADASNAQLSVRVYPNATSEFSNKKFFLEEGVLKVDIGLPGDGENEIFIWHMAYAVPQIVRAVSTPILSLARLNLAAHLSKDVALLFKQTTVSDSWQLRKKPELPGGSCRSMLGLDCSDVNDKDWVNVFLRQSEGPSETDLRFFRGALDIKSPIESRNLWYYLTNLCIGIGVAWLMSTLWDVVTFKGGLGDGRGTIGPVYDKDFYV